MTVTSLLRDRNYDELASAIRDRWAMNASHSDLECLYRLAFEADPPVVGGPVEQPWGNETWLLWIRNRLEDLATQSCAELLARFDWSVGPPPKTVEEWKKFLSEFNADLFANSGVRETLDENLISSGWLGLPPVSDTELAEFEDRVEKGLPPSYRSFFLVSNGWQATGWDGIRILPCDEVGWLRDVDPGCISSWCEAAGSCDVPDEAYFVYGDGQDCGNIRNEYMSDMLLISSSSWANQDYFLLNPRVVFDSGEWEAWHFSPDFPGAARYQSFGLLMQSQHADLKRE